ncbi:MAG: DNA-directed DNA polymerase [Candidatus Diapherotrites archaeon]|nr:DNA-directed DNA polymerase [Candidatus Micrarchaeota archaeon]MBU1939752.1 DNA-directed DNA polymerase [Candidatus Micrarchaeota archaeon]
MTEATVKGIGGILLDVDYTTENEHAVLGVYVRNAKSGKIEKFTEKNFSPYFYIIAESAGSAKKLEKEIPAHEFPNKIRACGTEIVKRVNAENVIKVSFRNTRELTEAREHVLKITGVKERREYDIPYVRRYLIDSGIEPMGRVEIEADENNEIKKIKKITGREGSGAAQEFKVGCFDIETFTRGRFPEADKDAVISIAYAGKGERTVFSYGEGWGKRKGLEIFADEKEMLRAFADKLKKEELDVIVTYNGDMFDFPYMKERMNKLGLKFDIGYGGAEPSFMNKGMDTAARVKGTQHLDAYQIVRTLTRIGALNLIKLDLESVVEGIFKKKKEKLSADKMAEMWKTRKGLEKLAQYNDEDAYYTLKIALEHMPLFVEIARLVRQTLFDASRAMSSTIVEALLISRAFESKRLIPNKPGEGDVKSRMLQTFKGGYVREPIPGLHENIAVLDFRSLHPSIIISHNVGPETLKCNHPKCEGGKNLSPDKDWFCMEERGIISEMLEDVLDMRMAVKGRMKKAEKGSREYAALNARQHALKIVLNSTYGSMGYARFRWYSRECARAVTAWSRHYIQETMKDAEKAGFKVLYGDTDSSLLLVPKGKTKNDVLEFVEKTNDKLPGVMELEFEGMFRRGIFVSTREGKAAKKRYALVDFDGNIKIVGFEYVRRDWSRVAKETQREILSIVLREGDVKKATEVLRKIIAELKSGKTPKRDLIIMTQIKKPLKEYAAIGPHVAAAKKAVERGKEMSVGSLVSYIITKKGKSISDRAELEEYVQEGDYDAEYYIGHQVMPAVEKVFIALGYKKDDLVEGGKQASLSSFA